MTFFRRWIKRTFQGTRTVRALPRRARLSVEVLEDRITPTTPSVLSIDYSSPTSQYTDAASVAYAVVFNTPVNNVAAADFQVVTSGAVQAATPVVVAGSNSSYTVTVNGIHGSGTLQLDLIGNGSITSQNSSTPLGSNGSFQGETYAIDQAGPSVVSIDRTTPAGPTTDASTVVFTVTFSEAVAGVDAADFALAKTGTVAATSTQAAPVSGSVYTVTVSGITGNGTLGLNLVDNGSIHDLAGNPLVPPKAPASFQNQATFVTGTDPFSLATADVNGDGKADLVVANFLNDTVSVLLGNGNGTFQAQHTYVTGAGPMSVAIGDVNGDGIPDLVTADFQDNAVSVLLGNGNGTFQAPQSYATGMTPGSVAIGDFSGDGIPDLVVTNFSSNTVSVLLGNGNGTFQAQQTYATGKNPDSVAIGNLTGDGVPDLVVANYSSNTVSVLLGNGNGTFQAQQTFAAGSASSLALGDVNGDGKTDLVASNYSGDTVSVLLGNGNGTFQAQQTFATGSAPISAVLSDVNGDGNSDLVVANRNSNTVSLLLGNGNGTFQAQQTLAVGANPYAVAIGDLNGDGRPDVAVANGFGSSVSVFLNSGNGNFTGQVYTITAGQTLPTSTVAALPAVTNTASFTVSWSGNDNGGGNSISSYSIYVSTNGGAFTSFLTNTTQTSATFTGVFGDTYGFYSVATDSAGNVQPTPASAQASTALLLPLGSPTVISHGSTAPISLSSLDPSPVGTVNYTVTFADPLLTLKTTYGLTLQDGLFNYRGEDEKYLLSNNGSNSAGNGYYVLMPTGKLYAYVKDAANDLDATLAATPVATLAPSVWYNPSLITINTGAPIVTTGTNPFYDLKIQYGLVTAATSDKLGANEMDLQSGNLSNKAGGELYVLMPDDKFYASGGSLGVNQLVADFTQAPYAAAVPSISTTIDQASGLTATATTLTVASSAGFVNEPLPFTVLIDAELIHVTKIVGTTWTIVRGYDGTTPATHANGAAVAFGDVYANPFLLTSATLPTGVGVTAATSSNDGGLLTLTPVAGFDRSVSVTVKAVDSAHTYTQTFTFTVNDTTPSIASVSPVTVNHNAAVPTVPLTVTDPDPDAALRTYSVAVVGYNPLYDLQVQYGLDAADQTQYYNYRHQDEKYFQSTNGSNPAGGYYYVLMPTDKLYAYVKDANNDLTATLNNQPVADFTQAPYSATGNVYNSTALLYAAAVPTSPTVAANRGPLEDIQTQYGLTIASNPATINERGADEKYLQSANGSNPAGGGYYVLMPTDKLYAWDGVSIATTIANAPVADFTQPPYAGVGNVWATPGLLTSAQPASVNNPVFNVKETFGLTTADVAKDYNNRGQDEKYLKSTNGSNSANGGWYVLMPNDELYTYIKDAKNDLTATLANPPVFNFTPYGNVYATPALLYASTGQAAAVTATISAAGVITLTPNAAFAGTVRITATVSDGAEMSKQSFLFTVKDNAPTLNPLSAVAALSTVGSTTVNYTASTYNGAAVLPAASISGYNPLYNEQQLYGLTAAPYQTTSTAKYFKSTNGSNSAYSKEYVLSNNDMLYAWDGNITTTLASQAVVNFTSATYASYGGANVYTTPSLLYAATQPAAPSITSSFPSAGSLRLTWPTGYKGTFLTTLYVGDGALETQQSFLVTVS